MKIVCNDASEMIIQSADIQADGSLLIKTISTTASELKKKFRDPLVTRKISRKSTRWSTGGLTAVSQASGLMRSST